MLTEMVQKKKKKEKAQTALPFCYTKVILNNQHESHKAEEFRQWESTSKKTLGVYLKWPSLVN